MVGSDVGFIGYGEVAHHFASDLAPLGLRMAAYTRSPHKSLDRASQVGVEILPDLPALLRSATTVFSCVWPESALAMAVDSAPHLSSRQRYVDLNSISPQTVEQMMSAMAGCPAAFVKVSLMDGILGKGIRVPMIAGGEEAETLCQLLQGYGMNIRPISSDPRKPAALKILRSACLKGLTAMIFEMVMAARRYGVEEEVLLSMEEFLTAEPLHTGAFRRMSTAAYHAQRRAQELDESIAAMEAVGVKPTIVRTVQDFYRYLAATGIADRVRPGELPSYESILEELEKGSPALQA